MPTTPEEKSFYLVRDVAEATGRVPRTIQLYWMHLFPGARKLHDAPNAPWIIPAKEFHKGVQKIKEYDQAKRERDQSED